MAYYQNTFEAIAKQNGVSFVGHRGGGSAGDAGRWVLLTPWQVWLLEESLRHTGGLSFEGSAGVDGSSVHGGPEHLRKGSAGGLFGPGSAVPPTPDGEFRLIKLQAQKKQDVAESAAGSVLEAALRGVGVGRQGGGSVPAWRAGGDSAGGDAIGPASGGDQAHLQARVGKLSQRLVSGAADVAVDVQHARASGSAIPSTGGVSSGEWAHSGGQRGGRSPASTRARVHLAGMSVEDGDVRVGDKAAGVLVQAQGDAATSRRGGGTDRARDMARVAGNSQAAVESLGVLADARVHAIQRVGSDGGKYVLRPSTSGADGLAEAGSMGQALFGSGPGGPRLPHPVSAAEGGEGGASTLTRWRGPLTGSGEDTVPAFSATAPGPASSLLGVVGEAAPPPLPGAYGGHGPGGGGVAPAAPPQLLTGLAGSYRHGPSGLPQRSAASGGHVWQAGTMRAAVTVDMVRGLRQYMSQLGTRDRLRLMLAEAMCRDPTCFTLGGGSGSGEGGVGGGHGSSTPGLGTVEAVLGGSDCVTPATPSVRVKVGGSIVSTAPDSRAAHEQGNSRGFGESVEDAESAGRSFLAAAVRGGVGGEGARDGASGPRPSVLLGEGGANPEHRASSAVLGDTTPSAPLLGGRDGLLRFLYMRMARERAGALGALTQGGGGSAAASPPPYGFAVPDPSASSPDLPAMGEDGALTHAEHTSVVDATNRLLVLVHVLLADIRLLQWRACNPAPVTVDTRPPGKAGEADGYVYGGLVSPGHTKTLHLPTPSPDIHKPPPDSAWGSVLGGGGQGGGEGGDVPAFATPHKLHSAATEGGLPVVSSVTELIAMSNLPAPLWGHVHDALRRVLARIPAALRQAYRRREQERHAAYRARVQWMKGQFARDLAEQRRRFEEAAAPLSSKVRGLERALGIARTQLRRARIQAAQQGVVLSELAPQVTRHAIQGVLAAVYGAGEGGGRLSPRSPRGGGEGAEDGSEWEDEGGEGGVEGGSGQDGYTPRVGSALARLRRAGRSVMAGEGGRSPGSPAHASTTLHMAPSASRLPPGSSVVLGSNSSAVKCALGPDGSLTFRDETEFLAAVVELLSDDAVTGNDVQGASAVGRTVHSNPFLRAIAGKIRDLAEKAHTSLYEREELVRSLRESQASVVEQVKRLRRQLVVTRWKAAAAHATLQRKYTAVTEELIMVQRECGAREARLEEEADLLSRTLDLVQQRERKRATGRLQGAAKDSAVLREVFGEGAVKTMYDLACRMQAAADAGLPLVLAARQGGLLPVAEGDAGASSPPVTAHTAAVSAIGARRQAPSSRSLLSSRGSAASPGSRGGGDDDGEGGSARTSPGGRRRKGRRKGGGSSRRLDTSPGTGSGAGGAAASAAAAAGSLALTADEAALLFAVLVAGGRLEGEGMGGAATPGAASAGTAASGFQVTPSGRGGDAAHRVAMALSRVVPLERGGEEAPWKAIGKPRVQTEGGVLSGSEGGSGKHDPWSILQPGDGAGLGEPGSSTPQYDDGRGVGEGMVGDRVDLEAGEVALPDAPPHRRTAGSSISRTLQRDASRAHWGAYGGADSELFEDDFAWLEANRAGAVAAGQGAATPQGRATASAGQLAPPRAEVDPVPAGSDSEMDVPRRRPSTVGQTGLAQGGRGAGGAAQGGRVSPLAPPAQQQQHPSGGEGRVTAGTVSVSGSSAPTSPPPGRRRYGRETLPSDASAAAAVGRGAGGLAHVTGRGAGQVQGAEQAEGGVEGVARGAQEGPASKAAGDERGQAGEGSDGTGASAPGPGAPPPTAPLHTSVTGVDKRRQAPLGTVLDHHRAITVGASDLRPADPVTVQEVSTRAGVKERGGTPTSSAQVSDLSTPQLSRTGDSAVHPTSPVDSEVAAELERVAARAARREALAKARAEADTLAPTAWGGGRSTSGSLRASPTGSPRSASPPSRQGTGLSSPLVADSGGESGPGMLTLPPPPTEEPEVLERAARRRRAARAKRRAARAKRAARSGVVRGSPSPGSSPAQASRKAARPRSVEPGYRWDEGGRFHTGSTGSSGTEEGEGSASPPDPLSPLEGGFVGGTQGGPRPGSREIRKPKPARQVGFDLSRNTVEAVRAYAALQAEQDGVSQPGEGAGQPSEVQQQRPLVGGIVREGGWSQHAPVQRVRGLSGMALGTGRLGSSGGRARAAGDDDDGVVEGGIIMARPPPGQGSALTSQLHGIMELYRRQGVDGELLREAMERVAGAEAAAQRDSDTTADSAASGGEGSAPRHRYLYPSGKGGRDGTGTDLHFLAVDGSSGLAVIGHDTSFRQQRRGGQGPGEGPADPRVLVPSKVAIGGALTDFNPGPSPQARGYLFRPGQWFDAAAAAQGATTDAEAETALAGVTLPPGITPRMFAEFSRNQAIMSKAILEAAKLQGVGPAQAQQLGLGLSVLSLAKAGREGWTAAITTAPPPAPQLGPLASVPQLPGSLRESFDLERLRADAGRLHRQWLSEGALLAWTQEGGRPPPLVQPGWESKEGGDGASTLTSLPPGEIEEYSLLPWYRLHARALPAEHVAAFSAAVEKLSYSSARGGPKRGAQRPPVPPSSPLRRPDSQELLVSDAGDDDGPGPVPVLPLGQAELGLDGSGRGVPIGPTHHVRGMTLAAVLGREGGHAPRPPQLSTGGTLPTPSAMGRTEGDADRQLRPAPPSARWGQAHKHLSLSKRLRFLRLRPRGEGGGPSAASPPETEMMLAVPQSSMPAHAQRVARAKAGMEAPREDTPGPGLTASQSARGRLSRRATGTWRGASLPSVRGGAEGAHAGDRGGLSASLSAVSLGGGSVSARGPLRAEGGATPALLRPSPGLTRSASSVLFTSTITSRQGAASADPLPDGSRPERQRRKGSSTASAGGLGLRRGGGRLAAPRALHAAVRQGLLQGTNTTEDGVVQYGSAVSRRSGYGEV